MMGKGLCGQSRSGALSHGGVALPSEPGVPHTRGCQEGTLSRSADYRAPRQLSSYQSSFHHEVAWEAVWGTGARGGGGSPLPASHVLTSTRALPYRSEVYWGAQAPALEAYICKDL